MSELSLDENDLPRPVRGYFGTFSHPWTWSLPSYLELARFFLFRKDISGIPKDEEELSRVLPIRKIDFDALESHKEEQGISVTWIGHSTALVHIDGLVVMTDPIFSDRASPVPYFGPKRFRAPACSVAEIPHLDACVVSHSHHDHLDHQSVVDLTARFPDMMWFVPLGVRAWLLRHCGVREDCVVELSWWDSHMFKGFTFSLTPAQHWTRRFAFDENKQLWGSWCVMGPKNRFFFAGDTGYHETIFKLIGKKHGPFQLALIPIGAYEPRFAMGPQHIDPAEAVKVHQDVQAMQSMGIHWGTFHIPCEHYLEPPQLLKEEAEKAQLSPNEFFVVQHGETKRILNSL